MRYHHQNLDKRPGDPRGEATGHLWREGRAWLRSARYVFCWEWALFRRTAVALSFSVSSESGPRLSFQLPFLLSLCFSLEPPWDSRLGRFCQKFDWYALGVRLFSGALWCDLWADSSCSSNRESFWHPHRRRFSIHPLDLLLGDVRYTERIIECGQVQVPMPERPYPALYKWYSWTQTRPRFPWWPLVSCGVGVTLDFKEPVPVPGKGENSWDCGGDELHGFSTPAVTVQEAVGNVVGVVLKDRARYANASWKPPAAGCNVG